MKKKLEETYEVNINDKNAENKEKDKEKIAQNILNRNICAINSISNLSLYNSIVNHEGTKYDWKNNMINYIYNTLLKPDLDNIKNGILEFIDKKKRDIELNSKITQNEKNYEEILNEAINTNTEIDEKVKIIQGHGKENVKLMKDLKGLEETLNKKYSKMMDSKLLKKRNKVVNNEAIIAKDIEIHKKEIIIMIKKY